MIGGTTGGQQTVQAGGKKREKAVDNAKFRSLRKALFAIRKSAVDSMVKVKGPSRPGRPPHRHRGRLAYSVWVDHEKGADEGVVGPAYSRAQKKGLPPWIGRMHEKGGVFGGKKKTKSGKIRKPAVYPARPYMKPAFDRNIHRFHKDWRGSLSVG